MLYKRNLVAKLEIAIATICLHCFSHQEPLVKGIVISAFLSGTIPFKARVRTLCHTRLGLSGQDRYGSYRTKGIHKAENFGRCLQVYSVQKSDSKR